MKAEELYRHFQEGRPVWIRSRRIVGLKMLHYAGRVYLTKDEDGLCEWWGDNEQVPAATTTEWSLEEASDRLHEAFDDTLRDLDD